VGTDPSLNTAVILDKTTRIQDLYRVGESVRDSKIRRILRAHVILRTQDRDEVLSMDQDKTASGREREATARESSGPVMRIDRARVEQSLNNLPALMRDARIVPYMEAGRLAGYRLSNIKPGSVYQQLGLRNNDVVLSVNGDTLTGPDQLVSLYEDLSGRGGGSVDLRVRRGSGFETLRYELQ
jgi:general secretion pathway protein C